VRAPPFPEPARAVAVAAAGLVVTVKVESAVLLDDVADVSIGLTTGVMLGRAVTDTGPGPSRAERLLLATTDSAVAGNVASGDAVRVTLKMLHIWAKAK
jgi:hypothetical protein